MVGNAIKFAAGTYPSSDVKGSSKAGAIEAPAVIQELEETIIPKEDPWKGTTGFLGAWRLVIVTYPSYATRPSRCLEISLSFLK
jgi:hypothetical protein